MTNQELAIPCSIPLAWIIRFLLPICSCLLLFPVSNIPATAQSGRFGYTRDNSDWWSQLRADESTANIAAQKREPAASNFTILGIDLGDNDPLEKVTAKLGKAQLVERGDASTGRHQICDASVNDPRIHLIFERGEVTDSFYLFADGPDWS